MYLYWTIMNSPSLCTCVYVHVIRKFTLLCSLYSITIFIKYALYFCSVIILLVLCSPFIN